LERDIVDDRQVEELLRRYRPAAPPESLRERCVPAPRLAPVWPWATAAAALLAITFALEAAATDAMASAGVAVAPDTTEQAAAQLAETLGGDDASRRLAKQVIGDEMRRDQEAVSTSAAPAGEMP
jgi:hypothetical protein